MKDNPRSFYIGIGVASALLFSFTAFRVFSVGFTHDESFTFLTFVEPYSLKHIIFHPEYSSANHLLNSILMKAVTFIAKPEVWFLRLHSLLGYGLFLYAGFQICRNLFRPFSGFAAFLLLNVNMFLLQFFSLARGYGLGLGLMMISLWLILKALEPGSRQRLHYALALISAGFACISNLSFLNFYCALLLVGTVARFLTCRRAKPESGFWKQFTAFAGTSVESVIITAALAFMLLPFAFNLSKLDQFYYGGRNGFIRDTVLSSINGYLYETTIPERWLQTAVFLASSVLILMLVFYLYIHFRAKNEPAAAAASCVYWIMFVSALSVVVQHWLLHTLYLIDRTAIFFVPLFVLTAAWTLAWEGRLRPLWMRCKASVLLGAALCLAIWQFVQVSNVKYAVPWRYDSETVSMLNDLHDSALKQSRSGRVRLGLSWYLQPSVAFYSKIHSLDWLSGVDRDGIKNRSFDYYYVSGEDLNDATAKADLVKQYASSSTCLFRSKDHSGVNR